MQQDGSRTPSNFERGWEHYMKEQWDSSIYYWNQVPKNAKDKYVAAFYSAKSYQQLKQYKDALKQVNYAIQKSDYKKEFWELKLQLLEVLGDYKGLKKDIYFVMEREGVSIKYLEKLLSTYERYKFNNKDKEFISKLIPFEDNILNTRVLSMLVQAYYYEEAFEVIDYLIEQNPWEAHNYFLKHSLLSHLDKDEEAYLLLKEMFDRFPLYPEIVNTYFLTAIQRNDVVIGQYVFDKLIENEAPISMIYHLWDYIIIQDLDVEWIKIWVASLKTTLAFPQYRNQHTLAIDDYLVNAFKNGYTDLYLEHIGLYFQLNPMDYHQRIFYLKVLEREHHKYFESELFVAISIFPKAWELYEWAIRYYNENGMLEEAKEMEEAYIYEKEVQNH